MLFISAALVAILLALVFVPSVICSRKAEKPVAVSAKEVEKEEEPEEEEPEEEPEE